MTDTSNKGDVHAAAAAELVWTDGAAADSAFAVVRLSSHAHFLIEQRRLVGDDTFAGATAAASGGDAVQAAGLRLRAEEVYVGVFHGFLTLRARDGEDAEKAAAFGSALLAAVARETPPSQFLSAAAATRMRVFRDLWERGFYVACGSKFSAELLAYDQPPAQAHALALVLVRDFDAPLEAVDVASHCRVATMVRKRLVFASRRPVGEETDGDDAATEESERDAVVYVGVDHALLATRHEQHEWQGERVRFSGE